MSLRRKLLGSAATIAVASMATIGGSFAYFGASTASASQFTNGTLVLSPSSQYIESFHITNWKPGDVLDATTPNVEPAMTLNSQGSLPMNVFMKVSIPNSVSNQTKNAIEVESLNFGTTDLLAQLKQQLNKGTITLADLEAASTGDVTLNGIKHVGVGKYIGFLKGAHAADGQDIKSLTYKLKFVDNGTDQNALQGEVTGINFTFTGLQYEGVTLNSGNLDNGSNGKSGGGDFKRIDDVTNNADTGTGSQNQ